MSIKGTQTEKNLLTAYIGECQARNMYTFFGGKARKEGYVQVADVFEETANQEKEHGKRFFNFLEGGALEITAPFPAGGNLSTEENLRKAAAGENHEHSDLYPRFAAIAREEGFAEIAKAFDAIAIAERQHERRFLAFAENIKAGRVFKRSEKVVWRCRNCGYRHEGSEAPGVCPACIHPQAHFELLGENW